MNKILDMMERELKQAFTASGYEDSFAKVVLSNRPDLCEYQCNGAMAAAKAYKKKPIDIANQVVEHLVSGGSHPVFSEAEAVMPGFINLKLSDAFLAEYAGAMASADKLGLEAPERPETVIVDYGGANVAKPLHVGHLRAAIIGESIKRMGRFLGHHMIGDVHLGDWGLQMGLIIEELKDRKPELVYLTNPLRDRFHRRRRLQSVSWRRYIPRPAPSQVMRRLRRGPSGDPEAPERICPVPAIWQHIMAVSVSDLKKNYANLNVEFDLWKGESDAEPYIGDMIQMLVDKGLAYESQGALVVDVAQDTDTKEIPPCLVRKSDGASLYATSDLATIVEREQDFKPDRYIYVVDKRQGMHFEQVFRVAKRAGIVKEDTPMIFLGFGTMNGKDGKPFKTREGGVMRLEKLIEEINEAVYKRIMENRTVSEDEARSTAAVVGLAASSTAICPTRLPRIMSLILSALPHLKVIQVRISSIPLSESSPLSPSTGRTEPGKPGCR